jgi:hypothetical protein
MDLSYNSPVGWNSTCSRTVPVVFAMFASSKLKTTPLIDMSAPTGRFPSP